MALSCRKRIFPLWWLFYLLLLSRQAQETRAQYNHDDGYHQDNLYHDYAMKQQEKEAAGG